MDLPQRLGQLSRLSSDLYETGSARSLPLSTRRSPSYLSHRSVENDPGSTSYGSTRSYTRTLSHSGASDYGSGSGMPVSRTLPLRRSLKTFDRSPQNILPEYDTAGPGGGGSMHHHHMSPSGSLRHSLFDSSKYDNPGSYLTRIRSASRERGERESSMASSSANRVARTLYPSSGTLSTTGEANGWEGGLDAVLSPSSSLAASIYSTTSGTTVGGVGSSISPISTTVSLNSESLLSPNSSSFSLDNGDSPGSSSSRLLSVQEKMNNYSQYYQSLTQSPFRRLPLASPSQIHANSNSNLATFGVGLSELRNAQPPTTLSRPVSFQPHPVVVPLMVDAPPMEVGLGTSTSDSGSATPCIQSPVSNPMSSSVTSPSISPPQVPSPVTVPYKSPQEISPQRSDDAKAAKPPSSSIPRWPTVSVRQHRPLSISSFPDGPRASSVSRVMSPPPHPQSGGQHGTSVMTKGPVEVGSPSVGIGILKRRDNSRATSVERITRLLERKSMPREMLANGDAAGDSAATTGSGKSKNAEEVNQIGNESTSVIGVVESEKANQSMKKPKFLQSLEKKWEKFTNKGSQNDDSGRSTMNNSVDMSCNNVTGTDQIDANGTSSAASPEPNQAGATSEESSSHEDNKFNESVLLRRALSPEKKVKPNSRLAAAGGTVGFMLGKFKKMEESPAAVSVTPAASSAVSRIPTGRPPLGINGVGGIGSRLGLLGRRTQMPYTGTTSDSVLTLTAKEMGRAADNSSGDESSGLLRSAAQIAQEKRRLHPKLEVKKEMPSCTIEGPVSPPVVLATQQQATSPPQIQIQDSTEPKVNYEVMPKMDLASLSPISVSEGERTESDESNAGTASPNSQMKSDSTSAVDDAESVSDRILRKSFYNRFNASGIDRNRRSHSVTPGSSRRIMPNSATATLRVNSNGGGSNGGVSSAKGSGNHQPVRRSVSPSASTVASAESKDSSDHSSTQNRSPSPYWSGLNKYNPNPLFKELMVGEDLGKSNTDVGKKTEYSRRITSKLSKLLREIESDLNSCQLTKTESGVSDDGDGALLLGGVTGHHHNSTLIPNRVMAPQITTAVATSSGVSTLKKKNNYNEN